MKFVLSFLLFICITDHAVSQIHSLSSELSSFYDLSRLPVYSENSISGQVSSYDTTGGNDDGFSGKYSFIRRNADSTLVIFDVHGAGVINRIWTPTPSDDTLDFYIDSNNKPAFSLKYLDLFSGKQYPFVAPLCGNQLGGYYCYLPILFSKSCRIIFRGKKTQFHQIQYRLFKHQDAVKPFSLNLNENEKQALKKIEALWNKKPKVFHDFYPYPTLGIDTILNIKPGTTATLLHSNVGGRNDGRLATSPFAPRSAGRPSARSSRRRPAPARADTRR